MTWDDERSSQKECRTTNQHGSVFIVTQPLFMTNRNLPRKNNALFFTSTNFTIALRTAK